ncbi:hypothetical protein AVEN_239936-1, partial [Araneus ventricosus]
DQFGTDLILLKRGQMMRNFPAFQTSTSHQRKDRSLMTHLMSTRLLHKVAAQYNGISNSRSTVPKRRLSSYAIVT